MAYKVQLKEKGTMYIKDVKFPYNQIIVVKKAVFDYIKETFPNKFRFLEDKPKPKVEERAEAKTQVPNYVKKGRQPKG